MRLGGCLCLNLGGIRYAGPPGESLRKLCFEVDKLLPVRVDLTALMENIALEIELAAAYGERQPAGKQAASQADARAGAGGDPRRPLLPSIKRHSPRGGDAHKNQPKETARRKKGT